MKPFIRIKVINGKEYLYEITPYYDPKTKKIRQKSKYLGKNKDGQPVKVRQKLPVRAYSYGEFIVFEDILSRFRIRESLSEYLTEEEAEAVVVVVLNRVTQPLALNHIATWYEGIYLYKKRGEIVFSSQRLSRLIEKIGSSSVDRLIGKSILKRLGTRRTLLYDITSVSSYSRGIGILEWGYNRDGDTLPQVNISLIIDRAEGIPVMYEVYPGRIVDVSTLSNTVKKLKGHGVEECMLVLDRGFFSVINIEQLHREGIDYIISAPHSLKTVKMALSRAQKALNDPNNMKLYNNEPLFIVDTEVQIGDITVKGYCYYNPKRAREEEEKFYRRLYDIKEVIEGIKPFNRRDLKQRIEEVAGQYKKYFKIKIGRDRITVSFRNNAIRQRTNRMGKFIILYSGEIDWQECLSSYKGKYLIEEGFDILKNDLRFYTPHVHKENTLRGLLFIHFLALLLKMRLLKMMRDKGIIKKYSITGLLTELSKLKLIELSDGSIIKTEQTKKQKEILSLLNLCA